MHKGTVIIWIHTDPIHLQLSYSGGSMILRNNGESQMQMMGVIAGIVDYRETHR